MLRTEIIKEHKLFYNPAYENAEDFDLWHRAAMAGVKIKNLDKVLLYYRQSDSQMSHDTNLGKRPAILKTYFREKLKTLLSFPEDGVFNILHHFIRGGKPESDADADLIFEQLQRIENLNTKEWLYTKDSFRAVLLGYRLRLLKCRYLDKNKRITFALETAKVIHSAGISCFWQYWKNEGRYFGKFGENKKYHGRIVLPVR
jgi:hypothetical protein